MVSVTIENINELLGEIEANISKAFYIAIDTEFSGLNLGGGSRESRFDGAQERYQHYRQNVQKAALLQLGIACFIPKASNDQPSEDDGEDMEDEKCFKVVCYNISLAPAQIGLRQFSSKIFSAEWTSMRFLKSHGFDLHKVVQSGVPFLTLEELEKFAKILAGGICGLRPKDFDTDALRCAEAEVDGLENSIDANSAIGSCIEITNLKSSPLVIHYLLREKHPELWTSPVSWTSLKIHVVGPEKRRQMEDKDFSLEDWLIKQSSVAGKIFARIVSDQKIVVGFQLLQDLLFIINSFYGCLPDNYSEFKRIVKDLFPNVYDGKILGNQLSRHQRINLFGHFESNALFELYQTLTHPKIIDVFKYAPQLLHDVRHSYYAYENHAHEAAFDAFMSGVVFLYCVFALNADEETELLMKARFPPPKPGQPERRPVRDRDGMTTLHKLPPLQLRRVPLDLKCIGAYRGLLHVHLSADRYVNILGEDEQADRSKNWIRLTSIDKNMSIMNSQIVTGYLEACAYEYKIHSQDEVIIACTSIDRAKKIADYAAETLGVSAEVFDSATLKNGPSNHIFKPKDSESRNRIIVGTLMMLALIGILIDRYTAN